MPDYGVIIDSNCRFDLGHGLGVYAIFENIGYPDPDPGIFLYYKLYRPDRRKLYNIAFNSIDQAVYYYYSHQVDFF